MNIIHLTVENPGFSYMIEGILAFQTEETTEFWSEPLYHFYPQLDKGHASSLPLVERRKYFEEVLESIYEEQKSVLLEKTKLYTATWNQYEPQITAALSEAFEVDCSKLFNNMRCNISLNPIEPRYLDTHTFDVFFLNSEKGFIGQAIHEIHPFYLVPCLAETIQGFLQRIRIPHPKMDIERNGGGNHHERPTFE